MPRSRELPIRAPWSDFPDVVIHASESAVKKHADYAAAKAGSVAAAQTLVESLLSESAVTNLASLVAGSGAQLIPVAAIEESGINRIPVAMAAILGDRLGLPIASDVVQINTVGHTGASGWVRLTRPPLFNGSVRTSARYVLVDDFVGQGGTFANLRGYLMANGAEVIGATVLTGKPYSARLRLLTETLGELRSKHGDLEAWWQLHFGYGFNLLTESEARYLLRAEDADTIRNRLAEAGLPDND